MTFFINGITGFLLCQDIRSSGPPEFTQETNPRVFRLDTKIVLRVHFLGEGTCYCKNLLKLWNGDILAPKTKGRPTIEDLRRENKNGHWGRLSRYLSEEVQLNDSVLRETVIENGVQLPL